MHAASVAMIIVRGCDAAIGVTIEEGMKTFGPAGAALAKGLKVEQDGEGHSRYPVRQTRSHRNTEHDERSPRKPHIFSL